MKKSIIGLMILLIVSFLTVTTFLLLKKQIPTDILVRLIFAICGMIALLILNIIRDSSLLLTFTIISYFFYLVDLFYPLCQNIFDKNILLINRSFLSNSEGIILLICVGYFVGIIFNKESL